VTGRHLSHPDHHREPGQPCTDRSTFAVFAGIAAVPTRRLTMLRAV